MADRIRFYAGAGPQRWQLQNDSFTRGQAFYVQAPTTMELPVFEGLPEKGSLSIDDPKLVWEEQDFREWVVSLLEKTKTTVVRDGKTVQVDVNSNTTWVEIDEDLIVSKVSKDRNPYLVLDLLTSNDDTDELVDRKIDTLNDIIDSFFENLGVRKVRGADTANQAATRRAARKGRK